MSNRERGGWLAVSFLLLAACAPATPRGPAEPATSTTPPTTSVDVIGGQTTSTSQLSTETTEPTPPGLLIFHRTRGFRHDSIPAGIEAFEFLGEKHGFETTATTDPNIFTEEGLGNFDVIVFLNTTGDVLDDDQQVAMESFIESGNGFVGIHSATDTEYEWGWYEGLIGAYFESHPAPQFAVVEVTAVDHPVMARIPPSFSRFDEWYNFQGVPAPGVTVLAALDESSYQGGTMGDSHPITWAHEYSGGRSVYTGFGHTIESFSEAVVLDQLANAILWAAGLERP